MLLSSLFTVSWLLFQCALTIVYGLHTVDDRKGLWTGLAGLVNSVGSQAWILSGDLNAVLNSNDRLNGADVSKYESQDFADFLFSNDIYELPSAGHFYSWSNKGEGSSRIASRIDRCLGNGIWMTMGILLLFMIMQGFQIIVPWCLIVNLSKDLFLSSTS